jgi:purine-binding chemotaxis protein CheW
MTIAIADPQQAQYLTFLVGDEEYGVSVLRAKEIIEYGDVTTVPSAPPCVRGVINLRGSVVPVVDLAVKFGRDPSPVTRRSCIVVVEVRGAGTQSVMGIVADRVSQVADLPPESIEPPPAFGAGIRTEWLLGLGRADRRFLLLLDVDSALADLAVCEAGQGVALPGDAASPSGTVAIATARTGASGA